MGDEQGREASIGDEGARDRAHAFDLFDLPADYFDAPAGWFRCLRDHDPLHVNSDGSVLLTRYADVRAIWREPSCVVDKRETFRRRFGDGPLLEHHTSTMLFRDPPDHDRLRAIVNPFFTQASIERLRPFVTEVVDTLLDEIEGKGEIDFVPDFAFRVPTAVICRMIGLPLEDGRYIHDLGNRVILPLNPTVDSTVIEAGHRAAGEFKEYLLRIVQREREHPDPTDSTMISALVAAERRGERISEVEILHMCIIMFNGGHETTTNLLAMSLNSLLDDPDQLAHFRAHPEITPTAVEECIRFVSPLQLQGRRTREKVSVPSGEIPDDTEVVVCQASANRDERVFSRPDALDLRRNPNPHLAFGAGIHFCIGRPLARLEATVVLPHLIARFRTIERAGPAISTRTPRFNALRALPLRVAA